MNFRDAYEFDPETYPGAGGLPGRLRAMMRSGQLGPDPDANATTPEYDADAYSGQAGLLGRLRPLAQEQAASMPAPANSGPMPSASPDPNFRQLVRVSPTPLPSISSAAAPYADNSQPSSEAIQPNEMELAQQARDAAAARLARGVRGDSRAQAPEPDLADIVKSTRIGLVNGAMNTAGLIGEMGTGFGYFPKNFVPNAFRSMDGRPLLPAGEPDYFRSWQSEELRRWIEGLLNVEFYQPRSRAGRYAETIGEMAPLILGGAAMGAARGGQVAATAMRGLPGTLAKHAVAPGVLVQGLEEALPDSKVGPTVQKIWPAVRHGLPYALGAQRYLSR